MKFFSSFYSRLSIIFLVLVIALGTGSLIIAFSAARHLFDEVEQILNREYAANIASELQPMTQNKYDSETIGDAIHYMMVLNPMVEIYIVDSRGNIRAYFTHPKEELKRYQIDPEPLERFIETDGFISIQGDDPRTESQKKPFSAAPLTMDGDDCYVYVILRGQSYDKSLLMLRSSYFLRSGISTFVLAVISTLIAGFSLFFLLTRRLRRLSSAVKIFEHGNLKYRTSVNGKDEIGALGRAFNEMASSIEDSMNRLYESEKSRRDQLANISHDLRSPLTAIRGSLETLLLKEQQMSDEERSRYLETSLKNVSSFQKLTEELFELAKLEAGQMHPQMELFSLAELIQDTVLKLKPGADSSGISLTAVPPETTPLVHGDIAMLERVFSNLIENAIQYSPRNSDVSIITAENEKSVEISVIDSGPGIAPEDIDRIFERFYRADKSRSRNLSGSGLGLAIAKEIIHLHGGRITVENTEDSGARFTVILPK